MHRTILLFLYTETSYLKAIQGITQQIAQLPSHYLKIGKFSQSPLYKALKKIFQDYEKILHPPLRHGQPRHGKGRKPYKFPPYPCFRPGSRPHRIISRQDRPGRLSNRRMPTSHRWHPTYTRRRMPTGSGCRPASAPSRSRRGTKGSSPPWCCRCGRY